MGFTEADVGFYEQNDKKNDMTDNINCNSNSESSINIKDDIASDIKNSQVDLNFGRDNLVGRRKRDHIEICLKKAVEPCLINEVKTKKNVWSRYELPYTALPEINLNDIDMTTDFFDWKISMPFLISSMTGGESYGRVINVNIAKACNAEGIPFGLGSMRIIKRDPSAVHSFDVKQFCQDVPMFANIGAVQLNYGFTAEDVNHLIDSVHADGLCVHINHLQEAVQPEGDTNFAGLISKLAELLPKINVPLIVKGVGHGIDLATFKKLVDIGVKMIDVSGLGGTSWAWVEGRRLPYGKEEENLGYLFRDVGISTDACLLQCSSYANRNNVKLIAGGGIRSGLDISKSLTMGSSFATAALPFLSAAITSPEAVRQIIRRYKNELKVSMFSCGAKNIVQLMNKKIILKSVI